MNYYQAEATFLLNKLYALREYTQRKLTAIVNKLFIFTIQPFLLMI